MTAKIPSSPSLHNGTTHTYIPSTVDPSEPPLSPRAKSPIAELLYMRWLEGLRIKWPNLMSSS